MLLVVIIALSGCLGLPADGSPPHAPSSERYEETSEVLLTLQSLPWKSDMVVLEVVPAPGKEIRSSVETFWPLNGDYDPCAMYYVGENGTALFGGDNAFALSSSYVSPQPVFHRAATGATLQWEDSKWVEGKEAPIPIVLGVGHLDYWRTREASVNITISSESPFRWRVAEEMPFHCVTRLEEFEGKSSTNALGFVEADGLRSQFQVNRSGLAWVMVAASEGEYAARFGTSNESQWNTSTTFAPAESCQMYHTSNLPASSWTLALDHARGRVEVSFLGADLPTWVAEWYASHPPTSGPCIVPTHSRPVSLVGLMR